MKWPRSSAECASPSRLLRIIETGLIEPFIASASVLLSRDDRGTRARQAQGQVHSASASRPPARDPREASARYLALRSRGRALCHRALDAPLPERDRARVRSGERAVARWGPASVESALGRDATQGGAAPNSGLRP